MAGRRRPYPSFSHRRLRLGCLMGTFSRPRRQLRSTRVIGASQPAPLRNSSVPFRPRSGHVDRPIRRFRRRACLRRQRSWEPGPARRRAGRATGTLDARTPSLRSGPRQGKRDGAIGPVLSEGPTLRFCFLVSVDFTTSKSGSGDSATSEVDVAAATASAFRSSAVFGTKRIAMRFPSCPLLSHPSHNTSSTSTGQEYAPVD